MNKSKKNLAVLCTSIFVILGMWLMLSVHCQAAETNNDEKQQTQTIRIGAFEDTFNYVDKNGVRRGYGYELMQALAGYTGWKFEYVICWPSFLPEVNLLRQATSLKSIYYDIRANDVFT